MTDADDPAHYPTIELTPGGPGSTVRKTSPIPQQRVSPDGDIDGSDSSSDSGSDSGDAGSDGDSDEAIAPGKRRRSAWKTAAVVVTCLVVVCSGTVVAAAFTLMNRYEDKVGRQDILGDVPKPVAVPNAKTSPMNFLVLGSDSRAADAAPEDDPDGSRSDTIMIVHVNADHTGAFIFSIPRDSYVNVPAGGSWKGGKNKINAAFAFGGAKLAAKTVYELTKIPLDGAMIVNFGGIHTMVGQVGTVNVCVPYDVRSIHTDRVWTQGCHEMGPDETEDFMRQRKSVPGGDFGRIHDQQIVVKALADKISSSGMLTNPIKLDQLIITAAESVTVDQSMNLRELIVAIKDVKPANIDFATTPYSGTMTTPAGSSVQLDMAKATTMFQAVIADKTADWQATNPRTGPDAS
jgi:LCP family protein required for cell wall assembly